MLPPDLERAFHKGATTQDVVDTALVLQMREGFDLIAAELAAILDGLAALAEGHRSTPCVGRTYGQHAAPVTFGFKAAVWLSGIAEAASGTRAAARAGARRLSRRPGRHARRPRLAAGPPCLAAFARGPRPRRAGPIAWHALPRPDGGGRAFGSPA